MNNSIALRNSKTRKCIKRNFGKFIISLIVVVSVVTIVVLCTNKTAQASESLSLSKYYKTVYINYGDTLWDIASDYTDGSSSEIKACVSEIKSINNLESDSITAGMRLVVPYFAQ